MSASFDHLKRPKSPSRLTRESIPPTITSFEYIPVDLYISAISSHEELHVMHFSIASTFALSNSLICLKSLSEYHRLLFAQIIFALSFGEYPEYTFYPLAVVVSS